ncbi:DUF6247 family protein [Microlunatus aurantiacus]|uniref:DUF6247 family protein n=1 Tax=Microlunatus aurantiacus TaxID=446786 RepID=UPI003CD06465
MLQLSWPAPDRRSAPCWPRCHLECAEFERDFAAAAEQAGGAVETAPLEIALDRWWRIAAVRGNPLADNERAMIDRARSGDFNGWRPGPNGLEASECRCTGRDGWKFQTPLHDLFRRDTQQIRMDETMGFDLRPWWCGCATTCRGAS